MTEEDRDLGREIEIVIADCATLKKVMYWAVSVLACMNVVILIIFAVQTFTIRRQEDLAWLRIDSIEKTILAEKEAINMRLSAIVSANTERERTFSDRFKLVDNALSELRLMTFNGQIGLTNRTLPRSMQELNKSEQ